MKQIHYIFTLLVVLMSSLQLKAQEKPANLWFQFDDRFTANDVMDLKDVDSIAFTNKSLKLYRFYPNTNQVLALPFNYRTDGVYRLDEVQRYLVKPSTYSSNNYTNENSTWCFQRSAESEHFIIYWAKGLTKQSNGNITGGASSSVCNVNNLLANAEKIWDVYVNKLGFLEPGNSTTDRVKIQMYIVNQSDWRADGSGVDGTIWKPGLGTSKTAQSHKTGIFHCNPWAASDNVTVAHEIGHTFQYLVSADLGMRHGLNYVLGQNSSGNEWWEDCANWQAHKVYPAAQFSSNWGNNQNMHHLNILHEGARYNNCYYQDWWCQKHGLNTVGRVWREAINPEDPIQAYMRMFGLNEETFADEQFEGYCHIASMDIDAWRTYGQGLIGSEQQRLKEVPSAILEKHLAGEDGWWIVDPAYCPQNYGYNANPLKVPAAGTVVKATFKGMTGIDGYRNINASYAGWRYGLVAYSSDGTRTYGDIGRTAEGEVSITVPENCKYIWFVVMGAPTTYWTHSWNDNDADDEQWPYTVKFTNTDPYGASRTYGDYPQDYQRRDTTVVINATLGYSADSYTSVRVQYDMDAISQALGLSTAQLKTIKPSRSYNPCFVGVNPDGTINSATTTTTSSSATSTASDRKYGHWFTTDGRVCSYTTSAGIFAEWYPDQYGCYVGQYPGKLTRGKTYTIRQAFIYKDAANKEYRATMVVNLLVN